MSRMLVPQPYQVTVGVTGAKSDAAGPMGEQVMRIGENGPLRSLMSFIETPNGLRYEFEGMSSLTLTVRANGDIVYHLKTNEIEYSDVIPDVIRRTFPPMGLKSRELDMISEFFARNNTLLSPQ